MINKVDTIEAIDKVIFNYKFLVDSHGFGTCPLCLTYRVEENYYTCGKCPNIVFPNKFHVGRGLGCNNRLDTHNLHYRKESDRMNLIQYWKKVRAFLNKRPAAAVRALSEGTRTGILEIAEKYKK